MTGFTSIALKGALLFFRWAVLAKPVANTLFAVSLVLLPVCFPVDAAMAEELVFKVIRLANGEWPPYTGQDRPGFGCDSQVVSESFALAGIRVEYVFLPWARGMLLSRNGLVDGAIEWEDTPAHRKSHFVSSKLLSTQEWVFFHRQGTSLDWNQLEDLHAQRIGLTLGYAYSDVFKGMQAQYPATFSEAASDVLNFRKLLSHRIDLFPLERSVGQYLLKSRFSAKERAAIALDPKPISVFEPHLLLSRQVKGNDRRMQLFDQGFQKLQDSGRYAEIMATCSSGMP